MDKKNTMLLTVIAVATLLVAVVGATFAYFSVTANSETNTTVITATSDKVGTVTLTNPTATLSLHVTAADMAFDKAGTPYYATDKTAEAGVSNYDASAVSRTVALATVTGGEANTKYNCDLNLKVTVGGTMADSLVAGDASLVMTGGGLNVNTDLTALEDNYEVEFNALTGTATTEDVKAYVVFNNTANANTQNALAGKTLTVTIANDTFVCDTVE